MEPKTLVLAEEGKQEILITRNFDIPVELLYKAFTEADLIEQWMSTKVLKLNFQKHGSFQYLTSGANGAQIRFHGTIHDFLPYKKIVRTMEMENMSFGVQLEVYEFEKIADGSSKLSQQVIYQSVNHRNENLKLPFKQGINWAYNRLEEIMTNPK